MPHYPSAFAWWYLNKDQKARLEVERRAGNTAFGGMGYKAPYLYAQEGSEELLGGKLKESAERAGITPTFFIRNALRAGRLTSDEVSDILLLR